MLGDRADRRSSCWRRSRHLDLSAGPARPSAGRAKVNWRTGHERLCRGRSRLETQPNATLFDVVQDRTVRITWKQEIRAQLRQIFNGAAFKLILDEATAIHARILRSRVFVALHMHAGDGNVHTNLPVNSDNYEMLQDAHEAVGRIMILARSLNGVISGEHGIGITKLEFLTEEEIGDFRSYKQASSGRPFQQGKLLNCRHWLRFAQCYTPSSPEGQILDLPKAYQRHAASVKDCLRLASVNPCARPMCRSPLLIRRANIWRPRPDRSLLYEEQRAAVFHQH